METPNDHEAAPDDYALPTPLARSVAGTMRTKHAACIDYGVPGSCVLGRITRDDVQEILTLAAALSR